MNKVKIKSLFAMMLMLAVLTVFGTACSNEKAEKEYADWYENYRSDIEDTMLAFAKKMMAIDAGNDGWLGSVEKSLFEVQKVIDEGNEKKNVPAAYKKAHEYLLKANKGYQYAVDETPKALESLDLDELDNISKRLDKAYDQTAKADDEVEKVSKDKE
ncbi:hypothetical protein ABQG68_03125 [Bacillus pumilus]|uniref:hypothetical protein n=1 Tax=Bacillus pumilus TaxID=1408 RepID=UPI003315A8C6